MINDKMLNKGDMIDGWKVTGYHGQRVLNCRLRVCRKLLKISAED